MSQQSFDQFLKTQQKASRRLITELNRILSTSALRMERDAKINATSFPRVQTGRLRSSIHGLIDAPQGSSRLILRAGGQSGGSDVDYAKYQEFGTRFIQPPRLFLGRAVLRERERLPNRLKDLLGVTLEVENA
tara:strand:+ start:112 stop:510 length:399 start_codon:yes stop_codon:yes gene_type:complete